MKSPNHHDIPMGQFRVSYIPGGMGLDHSAWWVVEKRLINGMYVDLRVQRLRRSEYK
jgi:hypothetical protein